MTAAAGQDNTPEAVPGAINGGGIGKGKGEGKGGLGRGGKGIKGETPTQN